MARRSFLVRIVVWGVTLLGGAGLMGCEEPFAPPYQVDRFRLLAVVADSPEAGPGQPVTATPVWASPQGPLDTQQSNFWGCPLAVGQALDVDPTCESRDVLGGGITAEVSMPRGIFPEEFVDTETEVGPFSRTERWLAALLGHNTIVGFSSERDGIIAEGFKRIAVVPAVPLALAWDELAPFDVRYSAEGVRLPNLNPALTGVTIVEDEAFGDVVTTVERGQTVQLVPAYDADTLESYRTIVADLSDLDLGSDEAFEIMPTTERQQRFVVVQRCEIPTFQWFVTEGTLRREVTRDVQVVGQVYEPRGVTCTGVTPDDFAPVRFSWPEEGEPADDDVVHAWVVMRDGRGGTDVMTFDIAVAP